MEENPELIQNGQNFDDMRFRAAPVFLIHDGGGTTFAYHCLNSLGRPTYGIYNPHFRSGGVFEGGVRGMGRLYAGIIRRSCAEASFPAERNSDGSVNILLGGWSMGGLLSLEIAKVLTGDHGVRIIGILMVDSIYPVHLTTEHVASFDRDHSDMSLSRNMYLSMKVMKEAVRLILDWDPPIWADDEVSERPPISLLRAVESLPTASAHGHVIDFYRHDQSLGWDNYDINMFLEIVDIEGNHFEVFSFQHIPGISRAIKQCFDKLERAGHAIH